MTPQVGPVIKRAFADDIEHRTTAFLPKELADLTPIEMPTDEAKWIRVDLSEQTVVAYEHDRPVRGFVISSGLSRTPTVTGEFRIKMKVPAQTMSGGEGAYSYNLPNVKWVQYFYAEYAFHGTYWHNDFGRPKSHGCINMTNADAKWLFDWAGPKWDGKTTWYHSSAANPGTLVIVTE
jgi:lipoprotein-anchoring transpeptidase ErfK/SrfK